MNLIRMVKTNLSPVFGLYKDEGYQVRGLVQIPSIPVRSFKPPMMRV